MYHPFVIWPVIGEKVFFPGLADLPVEDGPEDMPCANKIVPEDMTTYNV